MFIPIRTDYRRRKKPVVNYFLVCINILIFIAGFNALDEDNYRRIYEFVLQPGSLRWYQFVTSAFLHADYSHLLSNMLFLWVFGNNLNDRLGHTGYFIFYIVAAVVSAGGGMLFGQTSPMLGGSGAISAVTGAYLIMLPGVRITVLVLFILITVIEVSSLLFIGIQFLWDLYMVLQGGNQYVAYETHVAGYLYGILVASALLLLRILPRNQFDLLYLVNHKFRKIKFQQHVAAGNDPFMSRWGGGMERKAKKRKETPMSEEEIELRNTIREALRTHDTRTAAAAYQELCQIVDKPALPDQAMLDIANQLASENKHHLAAELYEKWLDGSANHDKTGDINLMLGLIYSRYLNKDDMAKSRLASAIKLITDPVRHTMASEALAQVEKRLAEQRIDHTGRVK